jgi:predicted ATPase
LVKARGDIATARQVVAPLYASFNEGFDTVDLKEARELLEQLRA